MSHLPGILGEISAVAGEDAALAIMRAVGGTRQYIPGKPDADHWLVKAVGREKAEIICRHLAGPSTVEGRLIGQTYTIPLGTAGSLRAAHRNVIRTMVRALESGATAAEAARTGGTHERTAYRLKRRLKGRKDASQGELF